MRIRQIQTQLNAEGKRVPVLDAKGQEIELASIDIPLDVEAAGPEVIDRYLIDPEGVLAELRPGAAPAAPAPATPARMIPEPAVEGSATPPNPEE
ncbi:MAG: hypothetical protein ACTHU0_02130 [Kofleriaceae bacterium]